MCVGKINAIHPWVFDFCSGNEIGVEVCPHFVPKADLRNLKMYFFNFAHKSALICRHISFPEQILNPWVGIWSEINQLNQIQYGLFFNLTIAHDILVRCTCQNIGVSPSWIWHAHIYITQRIGVTIQDDKSQSTKHVVEFQYFEYWLRRTAPSYLFIVGTTSYICNPYRCFLKMVFIHFKFTLSVDLKMNSIV